MTLYVKDLYTKKLYLTTLPFPTQEEAGNVYVGENGELVKMGPKYFDTETEVKNFLAQNFNDARVVWKRQEDLIADPERWKEV